MKKKASGKLRSRTVKSPAQKASKEMRAVIALSGQIVKLEQELKNKNAELKAAYIALNASLKVKKF